MNYQIENVTAEIVEMIRIDAADSNEIRNRLGLFPQHSSTEGDLPRKIVIDWERHCYLVPLKCYTREESGYFIFGLYIKKEWYILELGFFADKAFIRPKKDSLLSSNEIKEEIKKSLPLLGRFGQGPDDDSSNCPGNEIINLYFTEKEEDF